LNPSPPHLEERGNKVEKYRNMLPLHFGEGWGEELTALQNIKLFIVKMNTELYINSKYKFGYIRIISFINTQIPAFAPRTAARVGNYTIS